MRIVERWWEPWFQAWYTAVLDEYYMTTFYDDIRVRIDLDCRGQYVLDSEAL
jgi:hypothetical protein